jgi:apolipoprotein N-acyltransferase
MTFAGGAFLGIVSASLLAGAQHHTIAAPLALVALVPWLVATQRCGPTRAMVLGAVTGTAHGCLVAPWLPEALRELGSSPATSASGLLVTAAWAKAPTCAVLGLTAWLVRGTSATAASGCLAASVFALEWIVSTTRWGVPWAIVGHSQLPLTGVSQLAVSGGVPLVSALVLGVNAAVARLGVADRASAAPVVAALVAAWASLALLGMPLAQAVRQDPIAEAPYDLLVVQPDLPRGERWGGGVQGL